MRWRIALARLGCVWLLFIVGLIVGTAIGRIA